MRTLHLILTCLGSLVVPALAGALQQDGAARSYVTARLEPTTVSVGEEAELVIEIYGEYASDAELMPFPELAGLEFRKRSGPTFSVRSQSAGNGGGDQTIATYAVAIRALAVGEYDIRELSVLCQSDLAVPSNPVFLRVVDPSARAAPIGLSVEPDSLRAYAREPFRVRIRLELDTRVARSLTSSNTRFHLPWWNNVVAVSDEGQLQPSQKRFVLEGGNRSLLLSQQRQPIQKNGVYYEVLTGELIVLAPEAAMLSLAGSRFQTDVAKIGAATAATRSVEIRPVPGTDRPAAYRDAVGDFGFTAACDSDSVTVGDTVQVTLTLRELRPGKTNIQFAGFGPFDTVDGFQLFQREFDRGQGQRTARLDLSPKTEAVRQVPSFEFAWFDPDDEQFHRVETPPIPLDVRPHPEGKQLVDPSSGEAPSRSVSRLPFYALALVVVVILLRTVRKPQGRAARKPTGEAALNEFRSSHLRQRAVEERDLLEEARSLSRYLAAKFDAEPGRCFGIEVVELLSLHGVDAQLAREVGEYFEAVERSVYGGFPPPGTGPAAPENLVARLEAN